jgi:hypothetical protein
MIIALGITAMFALIFIGIALINDLRVTIGVAFLIGSHGLFVTLFQLFLSSQ